MQRTQTGIAAFAFLLLVAGCSDGGMSNTSGAAPDGAGLIERGRYLATIMDCSGCHNTGAFGPKPTEGFLEGGTVGFELPGMGVFYPPNLTSHPAAGIGRWSEADIATAVRTGKRPDGRELAPVMPWHAYSALTDDDAKALAAYLKSLPPSDHKVPGPATKESATQPYLSVTMPAGAKPKL
jgi:mono/diheme cytochrome c family protein